MKKETVKRLGELYAIRAVMSAISNNNDETQDVLTNNNLSLTKQIEQIQGTIDDTEREIEQKHSHKAEIEELDKLIKQKEEEKDLLKEKIVRRKGDAKTEIIVGVVAFFLIAPIAILIFGIIFIADTSVGVAFIIGTGLYIFSFALYIVLAYSMNKGDLKSNTIEYRKNKQAFKDCELVITEYNIQKAQLLDGINRGDKYTPKGFELKAEIDRKKEEIKAIKGKIDEGFKRVDVIKSQSSELIRQAKLRFNIVNFSDWDGLDLICYYIETGRADTIKEALFKIDEERKANTLNATLRYANMQICQSACYATDEIAFMIEDILFGFVSAINSRWEQDENIATKGGVLIEKVEEDKTAYRIYSVQEFKDALKQKMNVASNYLVEDIQSQLRA